MFLSLAWSCFFQWTHCLQASEFGNLPLQTIPYLLLLCLTMSAFQKFLQCLLNVVSVEKVSYKIHPVLLRHQCRFHCLLRNCRCCHYHLQNEQLLLPNTIEKMNGQRLWRFWPHSWCTMFIISFLSVPWEPISLCSLSLWSDFVFWVSILLVMVVHAFRWSVRNSRILLELSCLLNRCIARLSVSSLATGEQFRPAFGMLFQVHNSRTVHFFFTDDSASAWDNFPDQIESFETVGIALKFLLPYLSTHWIYLKQ